MLRLGGGILKGVSSHLPMNLVEASVRFGWDGVNLDHQNIANVVPIGDEFQSSFCVILGGGEVGRISVQI